MKITRILITNVHSTANAGDLALLEMAIQQLGEAFAPAELSAVVNWPDEPGLRQLPVKALPSPYALAGATRGDAVGRQILRAMNGFRLARRAAASGKFDGQPAGWRELLQAYQDADLVVGVAGNQFYSTGRWGWPFPLAALQVELAHMFGKPFYTMPQSLGPLRRSWERRMMRSLYGRGRWILLRDAVSLRLASEIGMPGGVVEYLPDPGFAYPAAPTETARAYLRELGWEGRPALGATVIAGMGRSLQAEAVQSYYRSLSEALAHFASETGVAIYLYAQVTGPTLVEDDRQAVQMVQQMLASYGCPVRAIIEPLGPGMLKALYGQMDFFLASRLHSGIFSISQGVPTLFIGYLSKTRGMLESLGRPEWSLELAGLQSDALAGRLSAGWENRAAMRGDIARLLPPIIESAGQAGRRIAAHVTLD